MTCLGSLLSHSFSKGRQVIGEARQARPRQAQYTCECLCIPVFDLPLLVLLKIGVACYGLVKPLRPKSERIPEVEHIMPAAEGQSALK